MSPLAIFVLIVLALVVIFIAYILIAIGIITSEDEENFPEEY